MAAGAAVPPPAQSVGPRRPAASHGEQACALASPRNRRDKNYVLKSRVGLLCDAETHLRSSESLKLNRDLRYWHNLFPEGCGNELRPIWIITPRPPIFRQQQVLLREEDTTGGRRSQTFITYAAIRWKRSVPFPRQQPIRETWRQASLFALR